MATLLPVNSLQLQHIPPHIPPEKCVRLLLCSGILPPFSRRLSPQVSLLLSLAFIRAMLQVLPLHCQPLLSAAQVLLFKLLHDALDEIILVLAFLEHLFQEPPTLCRRRKIEASPGTGLELRCHPTRLLDHLLRKFR